MAPSSPDQSRDQGTEQGSASAPGVVHELEEAEVQRQLLLRDAPVRAEPGAQQGPRPLHRVDVDLAEAVPVLVARILATSVADGLVPVAPGRQAGVDALLVGVDASVLGDGGLYGRLDVLLPHVGQQARDQLPAALDQAEDRWPVLLQRAAARRSRHPAAASAPPPCMRLIVSSVISLAWLAACWTRSGPASLHLCDGSPHHLVSGRPAEDA